MNPIIKLKIALLICGTLALSLAHARLDIQHWQTPEGARVFFTQTKGLPMLDVQLNFDAAASRDGNKFGLAILTNSMLGTATGKYSEIQIADKFASVGAGFAQESLKDMSILSVRTLTRPAALNTSLNLLTQIIARPKFEQQYLRRLKKQILRIIQAGEQSPESIAAKAFNQAIFADHPYAHSRIGTQASLPNITLADIQQHYQTYYVAKNLTIALVGNVSVAKAKQIARQLSHGLNIGTKPAPIEPVKPLKKASHTHIEFPSKQTHLLIGQVGVNRSHPDYYALYLGNYILGSNALTSILGEQIRQKQGLSYSVFSALTPMRKNGLFAITLQTKNAQFTTAKKSVLAVLKKFLATPISAQRLQNGKDSIIGGFALKTQSNANILAYLSVIGFYRLPLDYLSAFNSKIRAISAADIQQAFVRLIDQNKLAIVDVGARTE